MRMKMFKDGEELEEMCMVSIPDHLLFLVSHLRCIADFCRALPFWLVRVICRPRRTLPFRPRISS